MAGMLARQGTRMDFRRGTEAVGPAAPSRSRGARASGRPQGRPSGSLCVRLLRHVGLARFRLLAAGLIAGGGAVLGMSVSAYGTSVTEPHIMVVMMENESESELIGNPDAPNTNALATEYGLATESYAIGHPSLPNYLELLSGSSYGVTDDGTPSSESIPAGAQTLVNQLEAAGISWRAYMESMPSAGYTGGDSTCCGGQYYQHHNPFVYFPAVTSLPDFSTNMLPSTTIMTDLNSPTSPDFVWMTPNGTDDMHDGQANSDGDVNPSVGDAWLGSFVAQVQSTAWYAQGGNIIIEWDEGMDADTSGIGNAGEGGGGRIVTLDVSAALKAHPQQDSTPVNTAGVLHSIEGAYGLPYLADAADSANGNIDSMLAVTSQPAATTTTVAPTTTTTAGAPTTTVAPTTTTTAGAPTTTVAPTTTTTAGAPTTTVAPTTTTPRLRRPLCPLRPRWRPPRRSWLRRPPCPLRPLAPTTTTARSPDDHAVAPTTTVVPPESSATNTTVAAPTTTTEAPRAAPRVDGGAGGGSGGSNDTAAVSAPSSASGLHRCGSRRGDTRDRGGDARSLGRGPLDPGRRAAPPGRTTRLGRLERGTQRARKVGTPGQGDLSRRPLALPAVLAGADHSLSRPLRAVTHSPAA